MPRILFVDDEPTIRLAISAYLAPPDYEVDVAGDLASATELLRTREYAAVITDLRLSGGGPTEGLEVIRVARQRFPDAKAVLLTGYGSPAVEEEARTLGIDRYLEKPVPLPELERVLRELLGLSALPAR